MHLHTSEVSHCGAVSAAEAVKLYSEKGYSGIVVTDHFHSPRKQPEPETQAQWNRFIDSYLIGYKKAKEAAPKGFSVLLGLELRFPANDNDYLIYGVSEKLLRGNILLYRSSPKKFRAFCDEHDLLFFQAHPFRNHMTVVPPAYLHGIEIGNYNQRHDSRNDVAELWAEKYGLKTVTGSDFHEYEDLAHGGIYTDEPVTSNEQLLRILKTGSYTLKTAPNPKGR
jgi:hypothetical protein